MLSKYFHFKTPNSSNFPFLFSYSMDGKYIVTRDYLSVKLWDVAMNTKPVKTVALHDYLRPMLYDLYTSDIIFDKFEVAVSPNGKSIASGSYRSVLVFMMMIPTKFDQPFSSLSNQLKVFHQDSRGLQTVDLPHTVNNTGYVSSEAGTSPNTTAMSLSIGDLSDAAERMSISSKKNGFSLGNNSAPAELKLDEKVCSQAADSLLLFLTPT